MKQFIDFIPLLLFFLAYKISPHQVDLGGYSFQLGGIFSATAVLIASSVIVYGSIFAYQRKLDKGQWLTLIACLLFGGFTLAFHSESILKWKAPAVNLIFAVAFLGSHFIGNKPLIQRMLGHIVELPRPAWVRLNLAWVGFFIVCGLANLFVAFHFPSIWVDFKVFGSLAMTLVFLLGQSLYLARHMHHETPKPPVGAGYDKPRSALDVDQKR